LSESLYATESAGSDRWLMTWYLEQLFYRVSLVARAGINTQKCRGPCCHELTFVLTSVAAVLSAVCSLSTGTREAKWTSQHFKRSFRLNRFRCHNPRYTNATRCKQLKNTCRSKAYLTEKLGKELMRNFRRCCSDANPNYTHFALRDKVPFLAKIC